MPPATLPFRHLAVVEPDPAWAGHAATDAAAILDALAPHAALAGSRVHHIGSTAVPGLAAKPILDLLLAVPDDAALTALDGDATTALGRLGYVAHGEHGLPGRRFFTRSAPGPADRTHNLHAFVAGAREAVRHLAFRDYLRTRPDIALAYGHLKRSLAAGCGNDIDRYCEGKDAFIKHHEAAALRWMNTADQ